MGPLQVIFKYALPGLISAQDDVVTVEDECISRSRPLLLCPSALSP